MRMGRRTFRERWLARACALGLLAAVASSSASADPVFALAGSGTSVGQSLFVTARAADFIDLYGFQFTLNFDPSLVRFVGIEEGAFLRSGGTTFFDGGSVDNTTGTVSFVFDTLLGPIGGVSGSGDLARFEFTGLAPGLAAFALSDVLAVDSNLSTIDAQARAAAFGVPEPSTLLAVLLGLMSLAASRAAPARGRGVARSFRLAAMPLAGRA